MQKTVYVFPVLYLVFSFWGGRGWWWGGGGGFGCGGLGRSVQQDGVVIRMIRCMIYNTCSPKAHTVLNMEKRWRKDFRWSGRLSTSSRPLQQATDYQGSDPGTSRKLHLYSLPNFWKLRSGLGGDISNRERFEKKYLAIAAIISWVSRNESFVTRFYRSTCVVVMVNLLHFQWQIVVLWRHWQQSWRNCGRRYYYN